MQLECFRINDRCNIFIIVFMGGDSLDELHGIWKPLVDFRCRQQKYSDLNCSPTNDINDPRLAVFHYLTCNMGNSNHKIVLIINQ